MCCYLGLTPGTKWDELNLNGPMAQNVRRYIWSLDEDKVGPITDWVTESR
jgi:hypothetical protein